MFLSARVTDLEKLSENYYSAKLSLLTDQEIPRPKPFQFAMIWIPRKDLLPMTVADYENKKLRIIFKVVGEGTRELSKKPVFVGVSGFYGRGFENPEAEKILFVAGGSGIAPLPYLAKEVSLRKSFLDVMWGVKKSSELFDLSRVVSRDLLREIYLASEDCPGGGVFCGRVSELFIRYIDSGRWDLVIASGPREMLRAICREAIKKKLSVYVALEAVVKCGIGFCGSCVLKPLPKLLCRDGPVFSCYEVIEYLEAS